MATEHKLHIRPSSPLHRSIPPERARSGRNALKSKEEELAQTRPAGSKVESERMITGTPGDIASVLAWEKAKDHVRLRGPEKGQTGQFTIKCPKCSTDLFVSVASNGHTWGKCTNGQCKVAWME